MSFIFLCPVVDLQILQGNNLLLKRLTWVPNYITQIDMFEIIFKIILNYIQLNRIVHWPLKNWYLQLNIHILKMFLHFTHLYFN